mgnify:CR=1 FL=1
MTSIKAEKREISGKKVKNLRNEGKIPAIIYGAGESGLMLQISERDFEKVFKQAGESTLVEVEIGNEKRNVLIHDVSLDPIKDRPMHVDFLQVRMDKLIKATVELLFDGESPAVKLGGILVKVLREIEVEALPKDLPHQIKVDISKLVNLGDKLTIADLKLPSGVKIHADMEEVLILVEAPRSEEELKAEEAAAGVGIESIEVLTKKEKVAAALEEGEPRPEKSGREEKSDSKEETK